MIAHTQLRVWVFCVYGEESVRLEANGHRTRISGHRSASSGHRTKISGHRTNVIGHRISPT